MVDWHFIWLFLSKKKSIFFLLFAFLQIKNPKPFLSVQSVWIYTQETNIQTLLWVLEDLKQLWPNLNKKKQGEKIGCCYNLRGEKKKTNTHTPLYLKKVNYSSELARCTITTIEAGIEKVLAMPLACWTTLRKSISTILLHVTSPPR